MNTDFVSMYKEVRRKANYVGFGLELFAKNLDFGQLVIVSSVLMLSPAEDAGVMVGDIITHVNGADIMGEPVIQTKKRIIGTSAILNLRIRRRQRNMELGLSMKSSKSLSAYGRSEHIDLCYLRRRREFEGYGIWTNQSASKLGVHDTYVSHVEDRSPAFLAGVKVGDQILKIDNFNLEHCNEDEISKMFSKSFEGVTLLIKSRSDDQIFGQTDPQRLPNSYVVHRDI